MFATMSDEILKVLDPLFRERRFYFSDQACQILAGIALGRIGHEALSGPGSRRRFAWPDQIRRGRFCSRFRRRGFRRHGKHGEENWADIGYARLAAQEARGSAARVVVTFRGDVGKRDFGRIGRRSRRCSGGAETWIRSRGRRLAGAAVAEAGLGPDLRPARCEAPGFDSCCSWLSHRRPRPFPTNRHKTECDGVL